MSPLTAAGMQARNFTAASCWHETGIAPDFYSSGSLVSDIEQLCDPDHEVQDSELLNVAVKFFFAYVNEGAHADEVPYGEIAGLYELFSRHQSLNEPADDIEIMNRLRLWSPVLRVLADASRAAHIMRTVIGGSGLLTSTGGPFVGVDIGVGTGILLLAEQIHARRCGFGDVQTYGFQVDMLAGERTHDLVRSLGAGSLMLADPARPDAYGLLRGRAIQYVANETVAGIQSLLRVDNFFDKYRAFYASVGDEAKDAEYFPEGIIAHSRLDNASVILSRENGFQVPAEYLNAEFVPQGLILEGALLPMHKLGADFVRYLE
ncbi:hypothetical protein [Pseudodesulfovibrio sp.]|uniref:hypothetical protein n=1 Tax=unclassified Pseudodesulfovibrio TaxID=2661612 RepID=UPI003B006BCA